VSGHRWEHRAGVEVLTFPSLEGHPLDVVVTGRAGGVSTGPYATLNLGLHVGDDPTAVLENRRRAAATIDLGLDDLVFAAQVHGAGVAVVHEVDRARGARDAADAVAGTDVLVTERRHLGLVVLAADCVPVVLYDPVGQRLACVHAGWRGTVARAAAAAVVALEALGSRPSDLLAAIGPAADPATYQVGAEVADAVVGALGLAGEEAICPDGPDRWLLDLPRATVAVLADSGVDPRRVSLSGTVTGGGPFYSDRAARPCGRFGLLARLR
jgi:YfiH family protein